jgi:hypothetical protein
MQLFKEEHPFPLREPLSPKLQEQIAEITTDHYAGMIVDLLLAQEDKGKWVKDMTKISAGTVDLRELQSDKEKGDTFKANLAMILLTNGYNLELVDLHSPSDSNAGEKIQTYFSYYGFDLPKFTQEEVPLLFKNIGNRMINAAIDE